MKKILFIGVLLVSIVACDKPKKGDPDYTIQYDTIAGVDPNLLSLDLYTEGITASAPVVIWVHGGGWAIGDKQNQLEYKINLCKEQNYLLVSVNYRLTGTNGVMHPDHVTDVGTAVAWVYNHIGEYGGDSSKIVVMGHSAGAHLAALVCTDPQYLASHGLSLGIIDGCGSFDTEAYDLSASLGDPEADPTLYTNAFGTNASLWPLASPANYVTSGTGIPNRWIFARRGGSQREAILNSFVSQLTGIGSSCTVIDATSLTHEEVNTHIGMEGDVIMTPYVLTFLQQSFQ